MPIKSSAEGRVELARQPTEERLPACQRWSSSFRQYPAGFKWFAAPVHMDALEKRSGALLQKNWLNFVTVHIYDITRRKRYYLPGSMAEPCLAKKLLRGCLKTDGYASRPMTMIIKDLNRMPNGITRTSG